MRGWFTCFAICIRICYDGWMCLLWMLCGWLMTGTWMLLSLWCFGLNEWYEEEEENEDDVMMIIILGMDHRSLTNECEFIRNKCVWDLKMLGKRHISEGNGVRRLDRVLRQSHLQKTDLLSRWRVRPIVELAIHYCSPGALWMASRMAGWIGHPLLFTGSLDGVSDRRSNQPLLTIHVSSLDCRSDCWSGPMTLRLHNNPWFWGKMCTGRQYGFPITLRILKGVHCLNEKGGHGY